MDAREHGLAAVKARTQSSACGVQENRNEVGWDGVSGTCSEVSESKEKSYLTSFILTYLDNA